MPRFSDDDYIDFCVAEAVVRRGEEDEREGREKQDIAAEQKRITSPEHQKQWAEENALLNG